MKQISQWCLFSLGFWVVASLLSCSLVHADSSSDAREKQKLFLKHKQSVLEARVAGAETFSDEAKAICEDKHATITDCRRAIRKAEKSLASHAESATAESTPDSPQVIVIQPEHYHLEGTHKKSRREKLRDLQNEQPSKHPKLKEKQKPNLSSPRRQTLKP